MSVQNRQISIYRPDHFAKKYFFFLEVFLFWGSYRMVLYGSSPNRRAMRLIGALCVGRVATHSAFTWASAGCA